MLLPILENHAHSVLGVRCERRCGHYCQRRLPSPRWYSTGELLQETGHETRRQKHRIRLGQGRVRDRKGRVPSQKRILRPAPGLVPAATAPRSAGHSRVARCAKSHFHAAMPSSELGRKMPTFASLSDKSAAACARIGEVAPSRAITIRLDATLFRRSSAADRLRSSRLAGSSERISVSTASPPDSL